MQRTVNRRTFLQTALAHGGAMGSALGAGVVGGLLGTTPARAATGRALFGFPPGSVAATVGNAVLKELHGHYQPDLGRELVSIVGGSGVRSIEVCRNSPADGSTVLFNASSILTLMPNVRKLQGVDELIAVTPVADFTLAFAVGPGVPAEVRSMTDYVAWVRDNPKFGTYGLPGMGTSHHFIGLSLSRIGGLPLQPAAYQGMVPMTRDLLEGNLPAAIVILGSARDAQNEGRMRLLAVSSPTRWAATPELPTLRELGLSSVDVAHSLGFHMPAGTPAGKVQELNDAVQTAMRSPAMAALMKQCLMRGTHSTPADYAAVITRERAAWKLVVEKERFTLDG